MYISVYLAELSSLIVFPKNVKILSILEMNPDFETF